MEYHSRIKSISHEFYYHCVTRIVAGEYLLGDREKAVFRTIMRKVADFCGIDILTYCVMSNHIHILCRVPPSSSVGIDDAEIVRRYRVLFSNPSQYRPYHPDVLENLLRSNSPKGVAARSRLLKRMHDLSMFMKILKLRMSIWFNKTHGRFGTLWAEKFKSIVVEGRGNPLLQMAQYIDLNPVRAGITESPADYPYCGVADAKQGIPQARQGIEKIVQLTHRNLPPEEALSQYEEQLTTTLRHRPHTQLPNMRTSTPLMLRQTGLANSLAMGSREFINRLIEQFGSSFSRRTRTYGPTPRFLFDCESLYFGRSERPSKR